jgi:hypothetical protein
MGLDNSRVITHQCGYRNGFGWRKGEVVKHPAIGCLPFLPVCIDFGSGRFLAERQPFTGLRMKIFTQAGEFVTGGNAIQSEISRTLAKPLAGNGLALGIIIANRQMFLKILLGVSEIILRLGCEHGRQRRSAGYFCGCWSERMKPDGYSA